MEVFNPGGEETVLLLKFISLLLGGVSQGGTEDFLTTGTPLTDSLPVDPHGDPTPYNASCNACIYAVNSRHTVSIKKPKL